MSFGAGESRSWEEARRYGFICGGGGLWYSRTLNLLSIDDRVWVNIPSTGYVGVGVVIGQAQPFQDFHVDHHGQERPAREVLKLGHYHGAAADDLEKCEWFVPVQWRDTVEQANAVRESGFFGNRNTVAAPRAASWDTTVDRLKHAFTHWDDDRHAERLHSDSDSGPNPAQPPPTPPTAVERHSA